tara:strand:+ start:1545 stop:1952 length:408 start_codon:yes stop_codon:yes gene_type:complete
MRIYKKSRNPYLNLIKSIGNIYKDTNINIDEKLTEYEVTLNILKDDLSNYKFYTHPSFNNKWYKYKMMNSYVSNKINMRNPWHIFATNFIEIITSTFMDNKTKYYNISKELAWFENSIRVHDWVITKPVRKQKYA